MIFGHSWCDLPMIWPIIRKSPNSWQKKSLFAVTHALFCIYILTHCGPVVPYGMGILVKISFGSGLVHVASSYNLNQYWILINGASFVIVACKVHGQWWRF